MLAALVLVWATAAGAADVVTTPDAEASALATHTSLELDAAGNPVVSYTVTATDTIRILHCDDPNCAPVGESKQDPDTSANDVGTHDSLVLDASGYPVVSYRDETSQTLRILHCNDPNCDPAVNGAESITTPDTSGDDVGLYTSIQLDGSGYPVVSYHDATNGALKILHCNDPDCDATVNGAESIESPDGGTIAPAIANGVFTSLRLDASGHPVVAYGSEDDTLFAGDVVLKIMHCNDPDCAGADESITVPDPSDHTIFPHATLNGFFPSLQLDSGLPVVSYSSRLLGGPSGILSRLSVLRCNDANCAGGDEMPRTLVNFTTVPNPVSNALQLDALGFPVVAYLASSDFHLIHCNDAACDSGVNGPEPDREPAPGVATSSGLSLSLVLDAVGNPVASFNDVSGDLRILHCDDPGCDPPPVCGDGTVTPPEECDDGNAIAGDGCDDVCVDEFCGDGTVNDDGAEQCDDGNTAAGDGCDEACQTEGGDLGHFQCYDVRRQAFDRRTVDLADDFGPSTTEVRRPKMLCAPVNKNDEDPDAPNDADHLLGYEIRRGAPRFEGAAEQIVEDQFGTLVLDLRRPERLLVPTAKSLSGPAAPLDPPLVDHYQCYRVRGDRRRIKDVMVEDQFGTDVTDVKKPLRLCLPVDKNGEGILDGAARLMCYLIKPGPRVNYPVYVDNQFGAGTLEVRRARELCVPVVTPEGP